MKLLGIIVGSIILAIFLVWFLITSSVDSTPYFDTTYYQETMARIDSLKAATVIQSYDSLEAGFARVSITPELNQPEDNYSNGAFTKVPLAGYGGREGKPATGIHDSVFVTAAALRVVHHTIIFVSADLLIMPPNVIDSVTALLRKKGIQRHQLFLSATHTHSSVGAWGPGFVGELFAGEENPQIERWLALRISDVVVAAVEDLRPARIATGNFPVEAYTRNRLIGEVGTKNNDFSFIALEQKGHKKAIIGSYSAHATTLGADNFEISADYPGYWARKVEQTSADYALFFASSVGSQSPVGEGNGFDRSKYIGEALADSLNAHLQHTTLSDTATFACLTLKPELPEFNIRVTESTNLTTWLSNKLLPFSNNAYLQAVRLGDMVWITTPCDFSGEFALQLKNSLASYGFQTNVTSFNGGYVGYIVPGRYFYLDEYEPKVMGWFGPNMGEYTMDMIRQVSRVMTKQDNI